LGTVLFVLNKILGTVLFVLKRIQIKSSERNINSYNITNKTDLLKTKKPSLRFKKNRPLDSILVFENEKNRP
jgi:hypothetical protein